MLLVTHDFHDAAVLADRVGALAEGRVRQIGTASELIAAPADAFVASFTGANVLAGRARPAAGGLTEVALDGGGVVYSVDEAVGDVEVAVYPWDVSISRDVPHDSALNHIRGSIASLVIVGNRARVQVRGIVGEVTAASAERLELVEGDDVVASFKAAATRLVERLPLPAGR